MKKSFRICSLAAVVVAMSTAAAAAANESLKPTAEEAKWMDPACCAGYPGAKTTPPTISTEDTPEGKAVVATVTEPGGYQGLDVNFAKLIDLKLYKAITFDVKQNAGSEVTAWCYYGSGDGFRKSASVQNNVWTSVRLELNYKTLQAFTQGADAAPGKLKCFRINCGGALDSPGEMIAIRNLHFVPKSNEEVIADAKAAAAEEEEW